MNNTAQPGTAGTLNSAYWSANTFGGNQYAAASFPNSSGTNYGPAIAVRLSNSKGYFLWYGNSASTVSIWRMGQFLKLDPAQGQRQTHRMGLPRRHERLRLQANNRIWIGGYRLFQQDVADYDALLTAQGIQHTTETPTEMAHAWDSGWVPIAPAALHADSVNLD